MFKNKRILAVIPARFGSKRIKNKNIRRFANINFGLLEIKLGQLLRAKLINKIYLSTNDKKIIKFCKNLNKITKDFESIEIPSLDSLIKK